MVTTEELAEYEQELDIDSESIIPRIGDFWDTENFIRRSRIVITYIHREIKKNTLNERWERL